MKSWGSVAAVAIVALSIFQVCFWLQMLKENQRGLAENLYNNTILNLIETNIGFTTTTQTEPPRITVDYSLNRFQYPSWCTHKAAPLCPESRTSTASKSVCYPCQRRWLILICSGRSGSTTLLEMINALPGVRLGGENWDLFGQVQTLFQPYQDPKQVFAKWGRHGAWRHEPIAPSSWSCAGQKLFETINPAPITGGDSDDIAQTQRISDETTILGYKTIRMFEDLRPLITDSEMNTINSTDSTLPTTSLAALPKGYIAEKVKGLTKMFPCARIIANFREDQTAQLQSRKRALRKRDFRQEMIFLARERRAMQEFIRELGPERGYLLESSRWTSNVTVLNDVVDWLGFAPECHFQKPLEFNRPGTRMQEEQSLELDPRCRYVGGPNDGRRKSA